LKLRIAASLEPRIWVGSLADYNAGRHIGDWIDMSYIDSASELYEKINDILSRSQEPIAEEWFVGDHEGFGGISIGEYPDLKKLVDLSQALEEHGEALVGYFENHHYDSFSDIEEAVQGFEESYQGSFSDEKDFAWDLYHDIYGQNLEDLPADQLVLYVDTERLARDVSMDMTEDEEEALEDSYGSIENYVQELLDTEGPQMFNNPESYLDWDHMTRELMYDYWSYQDSDYNTHIYRSL
jgi:antirestriction protein